MDSENILLSVCITAYNHEKYIAQAVESVLDQQVDFNYEIVIGEDDSTDRTREIVREYQSKYPDKIRLFLNSRENVIYINGRASGAWNFYNNFRNAKGKYVALLDGDDYWITTDKLQKQVNALEVHHDSSICFHDAEILKEDGTACHYLASLGIKPKARFTLEDILYRNFLPTGSVVFRNRFISEIPQEAYRVLASDWLLHLTNAQYGDIIYIDEIMSCYRVHGQGLWSALGQAGMIREKIQIYEVLDGFLSHRYSQLIHKRIQDCSAQLAELEVPSKNLRICYILLHIPVPSETFVINEIVALQSLGVDIHTVSLRQVQICHNELFSCINNPVYYLSDATHQQLATNPFFSAACKLAASYGIPQALAAQAALAAEYLHPLAINHIHAHFATEAAYVALLVSQLIGIPFTFTAHAYDIFRQNEMGESFPDRRLKLLVENASRTITISAFNRNHIAAIAGQAFTGKLHVVHCGIDLQRFKEVVRMPFGKVTFLSVGRMVGKKGHDYLLRAFKHVLDVCDVSLKIVGDGDLLPELSALANELNIADKVTFLGAVSSDIVLNEMHNADVFALHSLTWSNGDREGIPVSIMEACATGLPVISTRHSGIPELVVEGVNGFLVDERDVDGFAKAMCTLASSRELRERMGQAGHAIVAEKFDLYREAQKLKDIFSKVIEEISPTQQKPMLVDDPSVVNYRVVKIKIKNVMKRLLGRK